MTGKYYINEDGSIELNSIDELTDKDKELVLNFVKNKVNKNAYLTENKVRYKRNKLMENKYYLNDMHKAYDMLNEDTEEVNTKTSVNLTESNHSKTKNKKIKLSEELKRLDRKEFDENCTCHELEALYESVKTKITPQQKQEIINKIRKNNTAEDIYDSISGMLSREANESLEESSGNKKLVQYYSMSKDGKTKHASLSLDSERKYASKHPEENISYIEDSRKNKFSLTEELHFDYANDADKVANEICCEAEKAGVWDPDIVDYSEDGDICKVTFEIEGDHSHDHSIFDLIAEEYLDKNGYTLINSQIYEDEDPETAGDSDNFTAQHTITFSKSGELEESLVITEEEGSVVRQQAVNGSLEEWDPQALMNKVMESGLSMNTHRFYKDKSYIINIFYKDLMGERGINNPDTKYWIDIVEMDESNSQKRIPPSSVDPLLSDEVVSVLTDWKNSIINGEDDGFNIE